MKHDNGGVHLVRKEHVFRRRGMVVLHTQNQYLNKDALRCKSNLEKGKCVNEKKRLLTWGSSEDNPAKWKKCIPDPDHRSGKEAGYVGVP